MRQGGPLGLLLFALTLHPVLARVDDPCAEAPLAPRQFQRCRQACAAAGVMRSLCMEDECVGLQRRITAAGYGIAHPLDLTSSASTAGTLGRL